MAGVDPFDAPFRDEAAELERDVETARLRGRTLAEALADLGARGDRVRVECGTNAVVGRVLHSEGDLTILDADEREATINLGGPVTVSLVEAAKAGGSSMRGGVGSFRARLLQFEVSGEPVVVVSDGSSMPGTIGTVAIDHVVVDRGMGESYVPMARIGYVTRTTPPGPPAG
jgi:hypothetical protein